MSLLTGTRSAPTWIRERFEWGPAIWPAYWCQIPEASELDCGALAAVAGEVLRNRGWDVKPVQLLQKFSDHDVQHWHDRWSQAGASTAWMDGALVYHEAAAILLPGRLLRIWDPTDGLWLVPARPDTYGTTQAIRVIAPPTEHDQRLHWEGQAVELNTWTPVLNGKLT